MGTRPLRQVTRPTGEGRVEGGGAEIVIGDSENFSANWVTFIFHFQDVSSFFRSIFHIICVQGKSKSTNKIKMVVLFQCIHAVPEAILKNNCVSYRPAG